MKRLIILTVLLLVACGGGEPDTPAPSKSFGWQLLTDSDSPRDVWRGCDDLGRAIYVGGGGGVAVVDNAPECEGGQG